MSLDAMRLMAGDFAEVSVGALMRESPVPPGAYWVDVLTAKQDAFNLWLRANAGKLVVRETRPFPAGGGHTYLFEVKEPVHWEGPGYPTIIERGATIEETVDRPDPEPSGLSQIEDILPSPKAAALSFFLLALVGGGVAAFLLSRQR